MTRVLSALALLPIVLGTLWYLPPLATLVLAEIALILAFSEYAALARQLGLDMPVALAGCAAATVCAAFYAGAWTVLAVLIAAFVVLAVVGLGAGRGRAMLADVAAATFGVIYLGVPFGALVAIRIDPGREALLLLLVTVMVSDTAQYYGGRMLGRRPLAPAISPKKTVEGAVCGFLAGPLVLAVAGGWWLPEIDPVRRVLLGAVLVGLGIAGDLFESQLKRGAGVKDASGLIPGHGGMLDRVDALLLAGPVYYAFLMLTSVPE
jgi:phosphatidate cytidylyltransferase